MKITKVKNVKDLRDQMIDVFNELRTGNLGITEAKSLSNVSGKIMSTAKTQMEYNKMTGNNKSKIVFLESNE